jgi:hypothetical protein
MWLHACGSAVKCAKANNVHLVICIYRLIAHCYSSKGISSQAIDVFTHYTLADCKYAVFWL